MNGLLGRKVGMSQVFNAETGDLVPVTILEVGPCTVVALKTAERHGYSAVQLGFDQVADEGTAAGNGKEEEEKGQGTEETTKEAKPRRRRSRRRLSRPLRGYFDAAKVSPQKHLRELRLKDGEDTQGLSVGSELRLADVFKDVEKVDIQGVSRGKGFAGVIKRWHFSGGGGSHGSMFHRAPGSIGQSSYPSRVFPGMKMPGRMGGEKVTAKNLRVIEVDAAQNMMVVQGAVPGGKGTLVIVIKSD